VLGIAREAFRRGIEQAVYTTYHAGQNIVWAYWMRTAFSLSSDPAVLRQALAAGRIRALHQQTALSLAIKCYERAVKVDPTYADAENNIGTVWYQRKRYGKAIRAYQKAIRLRQDMPVLYSNLAYAYFADKKYEESLASFRQALALDPQFFEQHGSRVGSILQDRSVGDRGRFYFLLAKSFAEAGNLERCIIYLRKAKDEGFTALAAAKSDPVFAAYLKLPEVQDALAPKPSDRVAQH